MLYRKLENCSVTASNNHGCQLSPPETWRWIRLYLDKASYRLFLALEAPVQKVVMGGQGRAIHEQANEQLSADYERPRAAR